MKEFEKFMKGKLIVVDDILPNFIDAKNPLNFKKQLDIVMILKSSISWNELITGLKIPVIKFSSVNDDLIKVIR